MQIIRSVRLKHFRSHDDFALTLAPSVSLLVGANGSGKTSVLEAVYLLLVGTSFKSADREMIQTGREELLAELTRVDGLVHRATVSAEAKQFKVGELKAKRLPAKNRYPVVLFEPDDLNLIHRSPTSRRDYFDRMIGAADPSFARSSGRYKKALAQRNRLLKSGFATRENLYAWDALLATYGVEMLAKRAFVAQELNQRLSGVYRTIADAPAEVELQYAGRVVDEAAYLKALAETFARDMVVGATTFGPHRDDFVYRFNQKPAAATASRGENRTIILAQKFLEAERLAVATNQAPVILLDDVFSELDHQRQTALMSNFSSHQILITAVTPPPGLEPLVVLG